MGRMLHSRMETLTELFARHLETHHVMDSEMFVTMFETGEVHSQTFTKIYQHLSSFDAELLEAFWFFWRDELTIKYSDGNLFVRYNMCSYCTDGDQLTEKMIRDLVDVAGETAHVHSTSFARQVVEQPNFPADLWETVLFDWERTELASHPTCPKEYRDIVQVGS